MKMYVIQQIGPLGCWDLFGEAYFDQQNAKSRLAELRIRHLIENGNPSLYMEESLCNMKPYTLVQRVVKDPSLWDKLNLYDEDSDGIFGLEEIFVQDFHNVKST